MDDTGSENVRELIEMGADVAGNATGAAVGFLLAGPIGGITGAAATPLLIATFKKLGNEIKNRLYSERELVRAGGAMAFALQKTQEYFDQGKQPRSDDFFNSSSNDRSSAQEILEGVLLAAQREHQEKKVRFYGNLYANIAFDASVDRPHANYLIRLLDRLSFRQLCWIAKIQSGYSFTYIQDVSQADIINELNELATMGIIKMEIQEGDKFADYSARPYGARVCDLFGLEGIDVKDIQALFRDSKRVE